ncbi:discoidin domain-containing protein [Ligaoa zhengdingensis]|uniref:discoidin domain-containing protein n=4 Tax=Ligaoa zhengdingensis TaxID=2763658 RepID=UPI0031BB4C89
MKKRAFKTVLAILLAAQLTLSSGIAAFGETTLPSAVGGEPLQTEVTLAQNEEGEASTDSILLSEEQAEFYIPQDKMTASASQSGSSDPASQAIDGDTDAADGNGKSVWASWGRGDDTVKDPQWIQLDFDGAYDVKAIEMTGRNNTSEGFITLYDLEVSEDGETFEKVIEDGTFEVPANGVAVRADLPETMNIKAIRLTAKDCMDSEKNQGMFWPAISNLEVVAAGEAEIPDGPESNIPQDKMTASASQSGKGDEPECAIDGDAMTAQNGKTVWASWGREDDTAKDPQWIQLDFDRAYAVKALKMTGRSNSTEGFITLYDLEISKDGETFEKVIEDGAFEVPTSNGAAVRTDLPKITRIKAIRLTAKDCTEYAKAPGNFWPAISNLDVIVVGEETEEPEPPEPTDPDAIWPTPEIAPEAAEVAGVENPVILLNDRQGSGTWKFLFDLPGAKPPSGEFDFSAWDGENWENIIVPGEILMQGWDILADKEYYYKTTVTIPADYAGNRILVRFHGVYSDARVWVDGKFVRNHVGGFTAWDCDITDVVGDFTGEDKQVELVVGVTDVHANPSYGSTYAHHNMGGILRDVELLALPNDYIKSIHVETDLDETFTDAELKLDVKLGMVSENATVEFELTDKDGDVVALEPGSVEIGKEASRAQVSIPVSDPLKWDAEHPNLYELKTTLKVDGEVMQVNTQKIGFREITYQVEDETYDRNKVYVNGKQVKLRGTCRHDVSYDLGRSLTDEQQRRELEAYKEMNINFLRTSHYPPSKKFLEICDELGLYVECETAVCFQYNYNSLGTASFLNQYTEMIELSRNHVSILMWSLGNESYHYGNPEVYHKKWDYVKATDTTRPAIFSWPASVRDGSVPYDIYSAHYVNWDLTGGGAGYGNPDYDNFPVIHDEYAHIPCYNISELQRDVNVRNFWGESLMRFWNNILESDGSLGGALWGGIDDVFYIPEGTTERYRFDSDGDVAGYGEWGSVLDVFFRLKPEAWLTKKAYSPVRLDEDNYEIPEAGAPLVLNAKNWFDHTNFDEVTMVYQINDGEAQVAALSSVAPHTAGTIEVPANNWKNGDKVNLKFYTGYEGEDELMIDEYNLVLGGVQVEFEPASEAAPAITEDGDLVTVSGENFTVKFSKEAAQITEGSFNGETLLTGGPKLNALGGMWTPDTEAPLTYKTEGNLAVVSLLGSYGDTQVRFDLKISGNGIITTDYTLLTAPSKTNGHTEVGVVYEIAQGVESVSWLRDGLWSAYPEDHIGRNEGTALRVRPGSDETPDVYGEMPNWPWKDDMRNFFLYPKDSEKDGIMTNDFKTMRENVWNYDVNYGENQPGIRVESADASVAARITIDKGGNENFVDDRDSRIVYSDGWDTYNSGSDYAGTETFSTKLGATAEFTFEGVGVRFIGSKQNNVGKLKIYIDGEFKEEIDTYSDLGNAMKQSPIYSIDNLPEGTHTIKVETSGGKYNCIVVDAFEVLTKTAPEIKETTKLVINNQWYYPELGWGNYSGVSGKLNEGSTGSVTIRLTGNVEEQPSDVDKTSLKALIAAVDGKYDETRYTAASWKALTEALNAAKAVVADVAATESQVFDAYLALVAARDGLTYAPDKSLLTLAVEIAEDLLKDESLTAATKEALQVAVNSAKAVLDNADATQAEINAEYAAVMTRITELVKADKTLLRQLIAAADALTEENYRPSSWANLQAVLTEAKAVEANGNATEAMIAEACSKLTAAINALQSEFNYAAINAAIKLAKEILADSKYDEASKAGLAELVAEAEALYESDEVTQKDLDDMAKNLTRAVAKVRLAQAVAEVNGLNAARYTAASWNAVQAAQAEAKALLANENATAEELTGAATKLANAVKSLVKKSGSSGSVSKVSDNDYWNEIIEKINGTEKGGTVKATLESGAMTPATVIDAAAAKGVKLNVEIGGKAYLLSNYAIDASAVYYSAAELIAMADGKAPAAGDAAGSGNANPETGGEVAATVPNAAAPAAGEAASANETIGGASEAQAENSLPGWTIAAIAVVLLAGAVLVVAIYRRRNSNEI